MRILINAFAFSPYRGSENAVGWNIACELAKRQDVTVIFGDVWGHCISRQDMQRYTGQMGDVFECEGLHAVYVPPTKLIAIITRLHKLPFCSMLYYLAYNLWQRKAYKVAKRLQGEKPFDVVHQLNMIGYREPGYMWKLDIPFVWGPVGGAPNEPLAYCGLFSWGGRFKVLIRTCLNEIQKHICWRAKKAARVAKKIWAVTDADYRMIHDIWDVKCDRLIEAGSDLSMRGVQRKWNRSDDFRIVWSGIHVSRKALPILILALKELKPNLRTDLKIRVDVLGEEGQETSKWKKLASSSGVADMFVWHGKMPREEALAIMQQAHILACTSIKEASSIVVIESISMGLPVICHDACGMGYIVDQTCGLKVPMNNPSESVRGFARAIRQVLDDSSLVEKLSEGALSRAKDLTWSAKAKVISQAYEEAVK